MGHPARKLDQRSRLIDLRLAGGDGFSLNRPPRWTDDVGVWSRWSAKCTVTLAARKHGFTAEQVADWFEAIDDGRAERSDAVMCAGVSGWTVGRMLLEKWAGQDERRRRYASLEPIAALAPGGSWDGSLGSGFGGAWTEDQIGSSGNAYGTVNAMMRPLTVSRATILESGGSTTIGVVAFHPNGITKVTAGGEGGTTEDATSITYNSDVDGSGWGSWGYWFTVNASDWTGSDGVAEFRFKGVLSTDGQERVLAGYEIIFNAGSTIPIPHAVVDPVSGDDGTGVLSTTKATAAASPYASIGAAMAAVTLGGWKAGEDGGAWIWLKAGLHPYGTPGDPASSQTRKDQTIVPFVIQPDTGVDGADVTITKAFCIIEDTTASGSGHASTCTYDNATDVWTFTRNGSSDTVADAATKTWAQLKTAIEALTPGGASYSVTIIDEDDTWDKATYLTRSAVDLNVDDEGQPRFIPMRLKSSDLRAQRVVIRDCKVWMGTSDMGSAFNNESSLLAFIGVDRQGAGKADSSSTVYGAANYSIIGVGSGTDLTAFIGGSISGVETVNKIGQLAGATISDIQDLQYCPLVWDCSYSDTTPVGGTHTDAWQWSGNDNQNNLIFGLNTVAGTSYSGTQGYFFETVGGAAGTETASEIAVVGYLFTGGGQCSFNEDGSGHLLIWSTFVDRDKAGGQGNWWLDYNQPGGQPAADYTDIYVSGCVFDVITWGESGSMPDPEDSISYCHLIDSTGFTVPGTFTDVTDGETVDGLFTDYDDDATPIGDLLSRVAASTVSPGWDRYNGNDQISGTAAIGAVAYVAPPAVASLSPSSVARGQSGVDITITGTDFVDGADATVSGSGITVNSTTFVSDTELTWNIDLAADATFGYRDVTVTNPDEQDDTLSNGLRVLGAGGLPGTDAFPASGSMMMQRVLPRWDRRKRRR